MEIKFFVNTTDEAQNPFLRTLTHRRQQEVVFQASFWQQPVKNPVLPHGASSIEKARIPSLPSRAFWLFHVNI
jgi:hypothetical protein